MQFNARGRAVGGETRINSITAGSQSGASVTSLDDGGWIVTWKSTHDGNQPDIYQKRYDSTGQAITDDVRVNLTTVGSQSQQSVTGLSDGGWIVTWRSPNQNSGDDIYQQRFDKDGNPQLRDSHGNLADRLVNSETDDNQQLPSVTGLADGGWVVTWQSQNQDGSDAGIYQQRYNAAGERVSYELLVNSTTVNRQCAPSVTALSDGGWLVTWLSNNQDADLFGIYQQRYSSRGVAVGGEVQVNTTSVGDQLYVSTSGLKDGGWIVTWTSEGQDGSGSGIYQQRFNKDGQKIGPTTPTGVNLSSLKVNEGGHLSIDVGDLSAEALMADGDFTYTLLDDAGGRFEIAGNRLKLKDHVKLDYEQTPLHVIKVLVKDAAGATCEKSFTISVTDVQEENLTGNSHSNVVKGGQYKDTFNGAEGNDILWGGYGSDALTGGSGKDIFVFNTVLGSARTNKNKNLDKITDFKVADDTIWLDNSVFTKLGKGAESSPGKLKKAFFTIGEKAKDRNDYLIYDKKNGKLYYDADGSGSKAAIEFAKLKKGLAMTEKDFFVI
jgi:Ca2+-binding RTX toxin-like protein